MTKSKGIDFILNFLNGDAFYAAFRALAYHGKFFNFSKSDMINHRNIGNYVSALSITSALRANNTHSPNTFTHLCTFPNRDADIPAEHVVFRRQFEHVVERERSQQTHRTEVVRERIEQRRDQTSPQDRSDRTVQYWLDSGRHEVMSIDGRETMSRWILFKPFTRFLFIYFFVRSGKLRSRRTRCCCRWAKSLASPRTTSNAIRTSAITTMSTW